MKKLFEDPTWQGLEDLRGALRTVLARHTQDENEVEDVIQETYLRAARYRRRLQDARRLRSWTVRIALNVLSDRKRREHRFVPTDPDDVLLDREVECGAFVQVESPVRLGRWEIDRERALDLLSRAMRGLREGDRSVLHSFYGGAQSCRATACECDIPPHLVKVRLFRARQRLSKAIRRELAFEVLIPSFAGGRA